MISTALAVAAISFYGSTETFAQIPDSRTQQRDSELQQLQDLVLKPQTRAEQLETQQHAQTPGTLVSGGQSSATDKVPSAASDGGSPHSGIHCKNLCNTKNVITKGLDS
jgi:hypothetical protein